jgi:hypothetical protein
MERKDFQDKSSGSNYSAFIPFSINGLVTPQIIPTAIKENMDIISIF